MEKTKFITSRLKRHYVSVPHNKQMYFMKTRVFYNHSSFLLLVVWILLLTKTYLLKFMTAELYN